MTLDRKLELVPLTFIGTLVLVIFIAVAIGRKEPSKYTIFSQNNTYRVDAFRVYGGQLAFEEGGKRVIIKGNYVIEINR